MFLGYIFIGLSLSFYFVYFVTKYILKKKFPGGLSAINPYRFIFNGGRLGKSTVAPTVLMVFLVFTLTVNSFVLDGTNHPTLQRFILYILAVLYVVILWYQYILQVKNNNTTQE